MSCIGGVYRGTAFFWGVVVILLTAVPLALISSRV
jgi:hypothetical protein